MRKRVTMQNIADALGVTKVSVSKALNCQPGVGEALRREILRTAREMGYEQRNEGATPKKGDGAPKLRLAFVCPKRFFLEDDAFYTTIYYYLNKHCVNTDHTMDCYVINHTDELALRVPDSLLAGGYDGMFIAGEPQHDYLAALRRLPIPQVAIDFYLPALDIDCVISDNFQLGQQVTRHLLDKGHTQIGFVGDIHATSSIADRYFGYRKTQVLTGLPIQPDWLINNCDADTGQYTLQFQLPHPMPTAFVCHCDKAAFTLMQRLEREGIRVPQDVSIISFDNTALSRLVLPHLSSVDFDRRQIATLSMQTMQERMDAPQMAPRRVYNQGSLILRDSVMPPITSAVDA